MTTIKSDGLKNSSYSNMNELYERISEEGDDQTWKGSFDFLEVLGRGMGMGKRDEPVLVGVVSDEVEG